MPVNCAQHKMNSFHSSLPSWAIFYKSTLKEVFFLHLFLIGLSCKAKLITRRASGVHICVKEVGICFKPSKNRLRLCAEWLKGFVSEGLVNQI